MVWLALVWLALVWLASVWLALVRLVLVWLALVWLGERCGQRGHRRVRRHPGGQRVRVGPV